MWQTSVVFVIQNSLVFLLTASLFLLGNHTHTLSPTLFPRSSDEVGSGGHVTAVWSISAVYFPHHCNWSEMTCSPVKANDIQYNLHRGPFLLDVTWKKRDLEISATILLLHGTLE